MVCQPASLVIATPIALPGCEVTGSTGLATAFLNDPGPDWQDRHPNPRRLAAAATSHKPAKIDTPKFYGRALDITPSTLCMTRLGLQILPSSLSQ